METLVLLPHIPMSDLIVGLTHTVCYVHVHIFVSRKSLTRLGNGGQVCTLTPEVGYQWLLSVGNFYKVQKYLSA